MVRWHPVSGVLPPVGEEAWQREFDAYRASPEYRLVNRGMSLAQFKRIFWMEYAHRMLGRGVGIAFLIPFLVFLAIRAIPPAMIPRLVGVFVLGGAQGVLGWYMVRSGLVDEPRVSQYRLAAHFSLAVVIYVWLLVLGLRAFDACASGRRGDGGDANVSGRGGDTGGIDVPARHGDADAPGAPGWRSGAGAVRWLALVAGVTVFATLVAGAFVAGLKAGHVYPTFPKMGGFWAPPGCSRHRPGGRTSSRTPSPCSSRIGRSLWRAASWYSPSGARVSWPACRAGRVPGPMRACSPSPHRPPSASPPCCSTCPLHWPPAIRRERSRC